MQKRRAHVVKVPTTTKILFPYSHYADEGHNPLLGATMEEANLVIACEDLFKLKPNVQANPRTRVDIYMPGRAAMELGVDIVEIFGAGNIAELAQVDPEAFRSGPQTLPRIHETRRVRHSGTNMSIAGFRIWGDQGPVYIDRESPNEGHIEMQGPEVHIGIPLQHIHGELDLSQIRYVSVPERELRVGGEVNPIKKARGILRLSFDQSQARDLAATLLHYGNTQLN